MSKRMNMAKRPLGAIGILSILLGLGLGITSCRSLPEKPDVPTSPAANEVVAKSAAVEAFGVEKVVRPLTAVCRLMEASVEEAQDGFRSVYEALQSQSVQPSGSALSLFYKPLAFDPRNARFEVCVPVESVDSFKDTPLVKGKTLPGGLMLSLVHEGAYASIHESYGKLLKGLKKYDVVGPSREVYLVLPDTALPQGEGKASTELQFPVMTKVPAPASAPAKEPVVPSEPPQDETTTP